VRDATTLLKFRRLQTDLFGNPHEQSTHRLVEERVPALFCESKSASVHQGINQ